MMNANNMPVVVGVDGSAAALAAVRLATREAARRGRDLRIVHAFIWPLLHVPVGASTEVSQGGLRHDAERILAEAAETATAVDDTVAVTTDLITGAPAPVLLHEARQADLLVLGDRGLGGFTGLLLGSVAVQVTSHCDTPVLVARGEEHPTGPVVLGVDGSPESAHAIEVAFAEADQRDTDLHAVHAWSPQPGVPPGLMPPPPYDAEKAQAEESRVLSTALADPHDRFPKVPLREELIEDSPARTLVRLSEVAQLVVLGARGRGGFKGLLLGSVSQQVLHHAGCPVLIVPCPQHPDGA